MSTRNPMGLNAIKETDLKVKELVGKPAWRLLAPHARAWQSRPSRAYRLLKRRFVAAIARQSLALDCDADHGVVPKLDEIDVAGFTQVIQVMAEAGELKAPLPAAERFIDLQYLKAAGLQ